MVWSIIVSGVLCFGISIAILFSIGDVTAALNTPTFFPIIEIFFNATKSYAATNAMVSALIISMFFSALGLLASSSRLIWAFARDDGLGLSLSRYFSHVSPTFVWLHATIDTRSRSTLASVFPFAPFCGAQSSWHSSD